MASIPLSAAFLLRSLGRPSWPSLLALPFAYGDSFAWGFVNSCAAWPVALVGVGTCLHTLAPPGARRWPLLLGVSVLATLSLHVAGFLFLLLAVALVLLLASVPPRSAPGRSLRRRGRLVVLLAILPGLALFLVWAARSLAAPVETVRGAPWRAWGPFLSAQNLVMKGVGRNAADLPSVLANVLRDGSDRWPALAAGVVALAACATRTLGGARPREEGGGDGLRTLVLLAGLALLLYFALPFDVRGRVYYLNTRFAQPVAVLTACLVPALAPRFERAFRVAAVAIAICLGVVMGRGFLAYDREARSLEALVLAGAPRPRVLGLVFDPFSRIVNHPVFLHAAAQFARERGGICNFSFASTPHSPVGYRGAPPPTFPSEWQPGEFRYEVQGAFYDHFLLRGADPERVFGSRLGSELETAAHEGTFWLVRRRRPAPSQATSSEVE